MMMNLPPDGFHRRGRAAARLATAMTIGLAAVLAACGGGNATSAPASTGGPIESVSTVEEPTQSSAPETAETSVGGLDATDSELAAGASGDGPQTAATATPVPTSEPTSTPIGERLDPAPIGLAGLDQFREVKGPQPVAIRLGDIGVDTSPVVSVGVNDDLTMEVPAAEQVGWYRFGPTPGGAGSAVLAAHIAFDGVDGVFRNLADVKVGSIVEIDFDDGSTQRWRIATLTDYVKEELPKSLFATDGSPQLALITCGGSFNPELRSYESNTVAVAVPA